jgi:ketosteroid isomerase-like protein
MATTMIRAKVLAGNKKFMAAFGQKNAAALAKLYTKGGELFPPGSEVVPGQTAIQAFWQGALDMGLAGVTLDTVEVEAHRDTAIEVGKYTLLTADGQVADAGKYVVIWKIEGRSWKLHRDIWNSSQPSPTK